MVLGAIIFPYNKIIALMLSHGEGILKKTNKKNLVIPLVHYPLFCPPFPNYPHGDNFFPHLYLVNICTCPQDKYLKIFIRPPFSLCHHGQK